MTQILRVDNRHTIGYISAVNYELNPRLEKPTEQQLFYSEMTKMTSLDINRKYDS